MGLKKGFTIEVKPFLNRSVYLLQHPASLYKMAPPVRRVLDVGCYPDLALTRGCVNHLSAAEIDANMTYEAHNITLLQLAHGVYRWIFTSASPAG